MKLNELNKIEEGIVSSIKGMFTGQGGYQTQVQDIFIKDFVQDALTSLNNGIKGGLIGTDVGSTDAAAPEEPASPDTPAEPATPTTPTTPTTPAPGGTAPATTPPPMRTVGPTSAQATVAASRKFNKDVTKAQSAQADVRISNDKLKKDAEIAAAKPKFQQNATDRVAIQKARSAGLISEHYDRLNNIFESIINLDEEAKLRTISDFMMDWFTQYMQGVEWSGSKAIIQQKLDQLQKEYPNNVKQHLTNLAKTALALSKAGSPAGAPSQFTQAQDQRQQTINRTYKDIQDELSYLAKMDPRAYNKLLQDLKPAKTGFFNENDQ